MFVSDLLGTSKPKKKKKRSPTLAFYGVPYAAVQTGTGDDTIGAGAGIDGGLGEAQLMEKKPAGAPSWKDSDAPDANGKFKELGVNALADWLIKTRGGNMQKITGSLNQQIVFNRKKNPAYARKMESVRAAVKRKLKKD